MRKLLLLFAAGVLSVCQLWAQRTITGIVTDDKGSPMANVSVVIKGTKSGTVTKADGTFSLSVSGSAKTLVFSSVEGGSQEVNIGEQSVMNITMKPQEKAMSEVVVTAFGIRKDKKSIGYSTTQLSNEQVNMSHNINITNALTGKVPGIRVNGSGGSFSGSSIIIRGYNTFTGSNQPLIVVDGIALNNGGGGNALQTGVTNSNRGIDINPDDIESMTVLKGPSASALYGARAANGVILITSKKGKQGEKNSIQFSTSYQIEQVDRFPEYQNQYAQGTGGNFPTTASGQTNASWGPEIKGQTVNQYNPATDKMDRAAPLMAYPNNVKDLFKNGYDWQSTVGFSGGNERTAFRFSYGYLKAQGVLDNNSLTKHNFSVNASSKVNSRLTVGAAATYTYNSSKRTQQGNQLSNPLFRGWFEPRSYDLTGLAFQDALGNQRYPMGEDNPYWTIKNNRFNDEINRLFGNVNFNLRLLSWLQADYKIGTDVFSTFRHGYDQIGARGQANTNAGGVGAVTETRNEYRSLTSNFFLTAHKRFGAFDVTALLGNEIFQEYNKTLTTTGQTLIVRDFENIKNTTNIQTPAVASTKYRLVGVYGEVTLLYKTLATLDGTLRSDWSSILKPGHQQYYFPSMTGTVSLLDLIPAIKSDFLQTVKLRGSIAKVGKATSEFAYSTDSYFTTARSADGFGPTILYPFNGLQGFTLSTAAGNPDLGPEFTTNHEIGLDISAWKNRLNVDLTIYKQKSKDLIFNVPISPAAGITSIVKNAGSLHTNGIELGVIVTPVQVKSFSWTINFNYTHFKSIVDELAPGVNTISLGGFVTPNIRLLPHTEYGQIYGSAYLRDLKTGKIIVNANGLPQVTTTDTIIGNPNPKYLIGATNTFTFKEFSFSIVIDYKKGGDIYSRNVADLQRNGTVKETAEFPRFDANGNPTKPYIFDAVYANGGTNTTYVSAENYYGNSGKFVASEGFIFDATWFRIREMSLSYHLPSRITSKTPFSSMDLSLFGHNVFMHAPHYPHLDPEQNVLGVSNAQGLEFNALPATRTMGVAFRFSL
jgi:TonB-linked SusC/RagA family outer membrane protein